MPEPSESIRNKLSREFYYRSYQEMGLRVSMAERGRKEEKSGYGSHGVIDIIDGPIQWVNVCIFSTGQNVVEDVVFGVPDPRITKIHRKAGMRTVRVKSFPIFGRAVELHWKGDWRLQRAISRLNEDASIKIPILESGDLKISVNTDLQSWIIHPNTVFPSVTFGVPTS